MTTGHTLNCAIVAGPPSCGKTTVLKRLIELNPQMEDFRMIKIDCSPESRSAEINIEDGFEIHLSGALCPDHFFAEQFNRTMNEVENEPPPGVIFETAGLCSRCSPHFRGIPAITVLSLETACHSPSKLGPMVAHADIVVLTFADIVSPSETRVFKSVVSRFNPRAAVLPVNAQSGEGMHVLSTRFNELLEKVDPDAAGRMLRNKLPAFVCSFCLGNRRISAMRS